MPFVRTFRPARRIRQLALPILLVAVLLGTAAPANADTVAPGAAANRITLWVNCGQLAQLTDAQLDGWKKLGVGGFICNIGWLYGMGGAQNFAGDPSTPLNTAQYTLQKSLVTSNVVNRAKARGIKFYLGFNSVNYYNTATPFKNWFDDAGWTQLSSLIYNTATAVNRLGFAGVAFENELYPQYTGKATAAWGWNFPGNTHTEQQVRDMVRQRGAQLMTQLVRGFPGLELHSYADRFPETWESLVQRTVNKIPDAYRQTVNINMWDGLTSVPGYSAVHFDDAIFYRTPQLSGATWPSALQYDNYHFFSLASRRFSNWAYAGPRVFLSPMASLIASPSSGAVAPNAATGQLTNFRVWGTGGEFTIFNYGVLNIAAYNPTYLTAFTNAKQPGTVDSVAPTSIDATATVTPAGNAVLSGHATDNMAVAAITWTNLTTGATGGAPANAELLSGSEIKGGTWDMAWQTPEIPLADGTNQFVVTITDIKGWTTTTEVDVDAPVDQPPT
jgi:hypothetical protein